MNGVCTNSSISSCRSENISIISNAVSKKGFCFNNCLAYTSLVFKALKGMKVYLYFLQKSVNTTLISQNL